jgi:hypothetical protein
MRCRAIGRRAIGRRYRQDHRVVDAGLRQIQLLLYGTAVIDARYPHGMLTRYAYTSGLLRSSGADRIR